MTDQVSNWLTREDTKDTSISKNQVRIASWPFVIKWRCFQRLGFTIEDDIGLVHKRYNCTAYDYESWTWNQHQQLTFFISCWCFCCRGLPNAHLLHLLFDIGLVKPGSGHHYCLPLESESCRTEFLEHSMMGVHTVSIIFWRDLGVLACWLPLLNFLPRTGVW